jgi:guanine deaminase
MLNPLPGGGVEYHADGVLAADASGILTFVGAFANLNPSEYGRSEGIILPPLLDAHIHIPQWPIRGRFTQGVESNPPGGRLLAGLNRNVFPTERKCQDIAVAEQCIRDFLDDTLSHGVVGGAAYMTVHTSATRRALEILPDTWSVGLVLMNMNCPEYLRTDEANLERDIAELAAQFGRRLIVTDRFAVAVDSPLRRRAVALAERFGLRMQTHLNEQFAEKAFVQKLYPWSKSYTDVYKTDGLLGQAPILAHCVRMSDEEYADVAAAPGACIAHCPTSNTLLGSGIMPLDRVKSAGIPYAICTDVGASPTTSLLAEAAQFLKVHGERASASEAIAGITQWPAEILGLSDQLGTFAVGRPMSFIEVDAGSVTADRDQSVRNLLRMDADLSPLAGSLDRLGQTGLDAGTDLEMLTRSVEATAESLKSAVKRVTLHGRSIFQRGG